MNEQPKILVVGSFVMDQIAVTKVFPRQGQTVLGEDFRKAPGGKGANQAVQAARLGADVTMVGMLGRDGNGEELLAACQKAGIHTEHVLIDDKTPSGCAVILLEEAEDGSAQNRILVIPGSNLKITPDKIAFLKDTIDKYDLVILQLEIPMETNVAVAKYAFDKGVPVMLNSAPSAPLPDELLRCLTYISPNEHEAEDLTGIRIRHEGRKFSMEDASAAALALRKKGIRNVLITLGSAGAVLFNEAGQFFSPSVDRVSAVDPTAAGDSFVAAFCTGCCRGWGWEEILRFANHTAAITVSRMGAMPSLPCLAEVEAFLPEGQRPDTSLLKKRSV